MFEKLIEQDKRLLFFLNNLGTEKWDPFWLFITKQFNWTPLFLIIVFFIFKCIGWKKSLFILLFLAVIIAFSDQFTNLIRITFKRLRPNNDPDIRYFLRTFICPKSYSFTSGHATTSTAVTVFCIYTLRRNLRFIKWLIFFPIFFAYSRLYLGVHFPTDIFAGVTIGFAIGFLFFKLYTFAESKYFFS